MNEFEREEANARWWRIFTAILGLGFLAGCLIVAATRSPHDDWFPVIWLAAMSGLCWWVSGVITILSWWFKRELLR